MKVGKLFRFTTLTHWRVSPPSRARALVHASSPSGFSVFSEASLCHMLFAVGGLDSELHMGQIPVRAVRKPMRKWERDDGGNVAHRCMLMKTFSNWPNANDSGIIERRRDPSRSKRLYPLSSSPGHARVIRSNSRSFCRKR